jgi:hypothetical protein
MDPHRLPRFLEGESHETERARTLSELAALPPDQLDVFADAAAILRKNEPNRPPSLPDDEQA